MLSPMEQVRAETVFRGYLFDVVEKRFRRADGSEVERQVAEHPGSVGIVAHDGECVYLVRQPREAVGEDGLLEIPAGTLDVDGESPRECAERELSEEVDLRAEHWSELQAIYPSPGFLSEKLTIFAATGLSEHPGETDDEEQIEVVRLPIAEIDSTLPDIEDAKTLIGLLLLRDKLS
jgi:8-oxo-dGTP pyrophosphatase MutT (NUDIX family)